MFETVFIVFKVTHKPFIKMESLRQECVCRPILKWNCKEQTSLFKSLPNRSWPFLNNFCYLVNNFIRTKIFFLHEWPNCNTRRIRIIGLKTPTNNTVPLVRCPSTRNLSSSKFKKKTKEKLVVIIPICSYEDS